MRAPFLLMRCHCRIVDILLRMCLTHGMHGRMRIAAGYPYPACILKGNFHAYDIGNRVDALL
jgi:hypothetical protein